MQQVSSNYPNVQLSSDMFLADSEFADNSFILEHNVVATKPIQSHAICLRETMGLEVNTSDVKILSICSAQSIQPMYVDGEVTDHVQKFKCSGCTIPNGQAKNGVNVRIKNTSHPKSAPPISHSPHNDLQSWSMTIARRGRQNTGDIDHRCLWLVLQAIKCITTC